MPGITSFAGCCGANILYGFGHNTTSDRTAFSKETIQIFLRDKKKLYKGAGILTGFLNEDQFHLKPWFTEEGFVFGPVFYHPAHGKEIIQFSYYPNTKELNGEVTSVKEEPKKEVPIYSGIRAGAINYVPNPDWDTVPQPRDANGRFA